MILKYVLIIVVFYLCLQNMSGDTHSSKFFHAVRKYSAITDKPTNPEPGPPFANRKCPRPLAENQNLSSNSLWRTKSSGKKPTQSTNWHDRSQSRNASSAFSCWRGGANTREKNTNPFGERRNKLGWSFSPASNGSLSALPVGACKAFGNTRNKFGSNSSIVSNCSTSSSVQPGDGFQPLSSSRKKFGSYWSVASESSSAVNGRGVGRGASYIRGNAASLNKSKTGRRVKPIRGSAEGSSELNLEYLNTLLQKEVHEIVIEVTIDKSPFNAYLQKSPLESDWLMIILNIVTKICVSEYEGNRSDFLCKLCDSPFFDNLSNYLGQMTVETNPETIEKLPIRDLCEFFSSLLDAWSMVAVKKNLKPLINKMKVVVKNTSVFLSVPIPEDILSKLETFIDEKQLAKKQMHSKVEKMADCAPPDDFRHLSLYPTTEDLFNTQRGFVRPNIIKGAYKNVEHYLDVQFRLLREDFIDSVRSGIQKYLASKSEPQRKFRFDSIRIYPDTYLENWERRSSNTQEVGIRLNFDPHKRFARTCDWVQNKRFMHGSLLLLTADDFNTFTCATVMERDVASLRKGCVLAALVGETPDFHKIFAKPFTMAESEVFFEPYFHILEALKKLNDASFPMPEYIVKGQSVTKCPLYPDEDIVRGLYFNSFQCISYQNRNYRWVVDSEYTTFWELVSDDNGQFVHVRYEPTISNSFQLDKYQMEAYEAGMKRDFCVIQGPPGTGKTFLGLKLVESILSECHRNGNKLPILVVCLTNHALDQFLERILAFTNKIVRVGGQSQNENLTSQNLRTLRSALFWLIRMRNRDFESMTFKIKKETTILGESIANLQKMKKYIETPVGILSTNLLKQVVDPNFLPVVENDETLWQWLLEDNEYEAPAEEDFVNFGHLYENGTMDNGNPEPIITKKGEKNTSFNLKSICEVNCLKSYSITLDGLEAKLRSTNEQLNALIENEDRLLEQGCDSSLIYFEKNYLKNQIKHLTRQYHKLKANLETCVENPDAKVFTALHQDPRKLLSKSRWQIYLSWLSGVQKKLLLELSELETRRRAKVIQHDEYKMFEDLYIMKQADVVGMTTTGAARLSKLLALLKPAIGKLELISICHFAMLVCLSATLPFLSVEGRW